MDSLLTCTHIANKLFQLGVLIEETLTAKDRRGQVSGEWLVGLRTKSTELLDSCQFQAELLTELKIEVRSFNEDLAEVRRAFAAPSLRVSYPRLPAAARSVLRERSLPALTHSPSPATQLISTALVRKPLQLSTTTT